MENVVSAIDLEDIPEVILCGHSVSVRFTAEPVKDLVVRVRYVARLRDEPLASSPSRFE